MPSFSPGPGCVEPTPSPRSSGFEATASSTSTGEPPFLLTLWKYLLQTVHTLLLLLWHRPRVVFVTHPPLFAVFPVYLYALVFRARFVNDFHTGPLVESYWKKWDRWQQFFARRAALNIVHNADNARIIESWGVRYKILPSLPPRLRMPPELPPERASSRGLHLLVQVRRARSRAPRGCGCPERCRLQSDRSRPGLVARDACPPTSS